MLYITYEMFMLVHMHPHVKSLVQADWVMHFQNGGLLPSQLVHPGFVARCAPTIGTMRGGIVLMLQYYLILESNFPQLLFPTN